MSTTDGQDDPIVSAGSDLPGWVAELEALVDGDANDMVRLETLMLEWRRADPHLEDATRERIWTLATGAPHPPTLTTTNNTAAEASADEALDSGGGQRLRHGR